MDLTVIGAGYVGLVTAAVFADFGNQVWAVEIDRDRVKKLKVGEVPFFEPGLGRLILKGVKEGRLKFTTNYSEALSKAEIVFICVGTPNHNGEIDLQFVYQAAKSVAQNLKRPAIIVLKSTVPPGINEKLEKWMRKFTKVNFELVSVPEFLREGKALEDTLKPYRVVIGTEKREVAQKLLELHQGIGGKRFVCDPASAQMIKYASNAFLPTKISFANAMAVLCDKYGSDVNKVMKGMGMDKRIGPAYLGVGLGYGGSCFPKDVAGLISLAKQVGYDFSILKAVQAINQAQINFFIKKVVKACGGSLKNKKMTVLGLSFKPGTSDMRESRSIYVIEELKKRGAKIHASDPIAIPEAKKMIQGIKFINDPYQALRASEALLLVTEWEEYRKLDFKKVKKLMKSPVVVDGRNIYNRNKLEKLGFIYEGIGQ